MPKIDMTGWTRGERGLFGALYKKAHGQSRNILKLTTIDIMALADIRSRVTFHAALRGLVRRDVLKAESVRCNSRSGQLHYFWNFILCDPSTGIPYADSAEEDRVDKDAYRKSYDPLGAFDTPSLEMTPPPADNNQRRLEPEHVQKYYSTKLPNTDFGSGGGWKSANCCFHPDQKPSLSVHNKTGNFLCHGCGAKGNIYSFEMRLLGTTVFEEALKSVHDIVGLKVPPKKTIKRIKNDIGLYRYEDENGSLLHELLRYRRPDREHTQYSARRRSADGRVWIDNANGVRRVIYNLPAVIKASVVLIAEGEKDADRLASLGLIAADGSPVSCTTNPFGAGNWRDEYSQYLKGKRVVVMGDNDKKGIAHSAAICKSIGELAGELRQITLYPAKLEGEAKQDVSDYLDQHSANELLELMGIDWFRPSNLPTTIPIIA